MITDAQILLALNYSLAFIVHVYENGADFAEFSNETTVWVWERGVEYSRKPDLPRFLP